MTHNKILPKIDASLQGEAGISPRGKNKNLTHNQHYRIPKDEVGC